MYGKKSTTKPANPLIGYWYKQYFANNLAELSIEPAIASLGLPYRYQHLDLSRQIIMDFGMPSIKLDVEIDGESHKRNDQMRKDADRKIELKKIGWTVYRIQNEDAIADPYGAVDRMMEELGLPYRTVATARLGDS